MLLTIHNLPSDTSYADVKALIYAQCGLSNVILDNLIPESNGKKVTVGVADDSDASMLTGKLHGLFIHGHQLYVENVKQKKAAEPYKSSIPPLMPKSYTNSAQMFGMTSYPQLTTRPQANKDNVPMLSQNSSMSFGFEPTPQGSVPFYLSKQNTFSSYGMQSQQQQPSFSAQQNSGFSQQSSQNTPTWSTRNNFQANTPANQSDANTRSQPDMGSSQYDHYSNEDRRSESNYDPWNNDRDRSEPRRQSSDRRSNYSGNNRFNEEQRQSRSSSNHSRRNDRFDRDSSRDRKFENRGYDNRSHESGSRRSPSNFGRSGSNSRDSNSNDRSQMSHRFGGMNNSDQRNSNPYTSYNEPKKQFGVASNRGNTYAPNRGNANAPHRGNTNAPHRGNTNAPNRGNANAPHRGNTNAPHRGNTNAPNRGNANAPHRGNTNAPHRGYTNAPNRGNANAPNRGKGNASNRGNTNAPIRGNAPNRSNSNASNRGNAHAPNRGNGNAPKRGNGNAPKRGNANAPNRGNANAPHKANAFKRPLPEEWKKQQDGSGSSKKGRSQIITRFYKFDKDHAKPLTKLQTIFESDDKKREVVSKYIASEIVKTSSNPQIGTEKPLLLLNRCIRARLEIALGYYIDLDTPDIMALYRTLFPEHDDEKLCEAIVNRATNEEPEKEEEMLLSSYLEPEGEAIDPNEDDGFKDTEQWTAPGPSLPSYPGGNKKEFNKSVKAQMVREQLTSFEDMFKNSKIPQSAVEDEVADIIEAVKEAFANPKTDAERMVCERILKGIQPESKQAEDSGRKRKTPLDFLAETLKIQVAKRVLNVGMVPAVRIMGVTKCPKKPSLANFLKDKGVVSLKKSDRKPMFIAHMDSYQSFNNLIGMKNVLIDGLPIKFRPMHVTEKPKLPKSLRNQLQQPKNFSQDIDKLLEHDINKPKVYEPPGTSLQQKPLPIPQETPKQPLSKNKPPVPVATKDQPFGPYTPKPKTISTSQTCLANTLPNTEANVQPQANVLETNKTKTTEENAGETSEKDGGNKVVLQELSVHLERLPEKSQNSSDKEIEAEIDDDDDIGETVEDIDDVDEDIDDVGDDDLEDY